MSRTTHAASLRQVTLALRTKAIDHETAVEVLESLLDAYDLHQQTNMARERRERADYLASLPQLRKTLDSIEADASILAAVDA